MNPTVVIVSVIAALVAVALFVVMSGGSTKVGGEEIGVDGPRARELVEGGATLVDVRTPGEFKSGHIDGAVNIPLQEIKRRHSEIPAGPVVLYCRSGNRSAQAARALHGLGHTELYDLGPMHAW